MSVFTSLITETLTVPGEPSHTITIRRIAPKHLQAAADAHLPKVRAAQREAMADLAAMGSPAFIKELREVFGDGDGALEKAASKADPLDKYDRLMLIQAGVIAWSFDRAIDRDAIEDLDDDTAHWLATAILRLAKPSLYAAEEADTKNG